jgi:hypothetical protein
MYEKELSIAGPLMPWRIKGLAGQISIDRLCVVGSLLSSLLHIPLLANRHLNLPSNGPLAPFPRARFYVAIEG